MVVDRDIATALVVHCLDLTNGLPPEPVVR